MVLEARAAGGAKALKTTPERWDIPQEGEGSLTSMEMPGASQETYTYTQRTETVLSGGGVMGVENSHEGRAQRLWGWKGGQMSLTRPTCQLAQPPQNIRAWSKSQHHTPLQATPIRTPKGEQPGQ